MCESVRRGLGSVCVCGRGEVGRGEGGGGRGEGGLQAHITTAVEWYCCAWVQRPRAKVKPKAVF